MSNEIENVGLTASTTVDEEGEMPSNALHVQRQSKEQLTLMQKEKQTEEEGEEKEEMDKIGKPKDKKTFKKPVVRAESEDLNIESFFRMLCRCQSDRMDEQRAVLSYQEGRTESKSGTLLRSASCAEKIINSSERIWDSRTNLHSERKNYQCAELRPVIKKPLKATKGASLPGLQPQRTTLTKPEEDFLDMVARIQGSRLEDQRTELPRPKPEEGPKALPDDDFFNQLMRAQADRMDDQRATIPAKSESSDEGDSSTNK